MRLGLQNIVWGKTEVFRTTDQWNPQDLALSSLPTLEESRIALWSARAVYSLYDVGPLEDVRLEVAANLDRFEPADLGACGEPYAADSVCVITNAIATHSYLGVGIAGVDRPESPWKDASRSRDRRAHRVALGPLQLRAHGLLGARRSPLRRRDLLLRPQRRSATGRPVVARLPGQALGTCARGGQIAPGSGEQAERDVARDRLQHRVRVASLLGDDRAEAVRARGLGHRHAARRRAARRQHRDPRRHRQRSRLPAPGRRARLRQRVLARPGRAGRGEQRAPVPVVESAAVRVDVPRDGRDRRGARARRVRVDVLRERRQSAQRGRADRRGVRVGVRGRSRRPDHGPLHADRAELPAERGESTGC